ncbi:MAG: RNA-binding transcriptional accessory protein, partial [Planctomycetes bacterium]|nr:RNA-binding transcriptional accessory protein [Planctomycetota bacterium]
RPKRRTRATIAREKGLEPLAELIFEQEESTDPEKVSEDYIDSEKGVDTTDEALAGARDIIAEWVNENQDAREKMRELFAERGIIRSKAVKDKIEEGAKYKDYFEWEESVSNAPSHRVLAMRRGENEGFLNLGINPPEDDALGILENMFLKGTNLSSEQVKEAVHDSYKRLLSLSMETEIRLESKKKADEEAIKVFVENLQQLLLSSPLGEKRTMAIDPGFRTGCKVVCLDSQGKLLDNDTIFPHTGGVQVDESIAKVKNLCIKHEIEAIAIGNGTAGRETET